jgi:hypothetical protein
MRRTKKRRYSESDTFLNPITVNLSTRPFAPSQSDTSEEHEIPDRNIIQAKFTSSEDLLSKLSVRADDTSSEPIQRKPENRLKAIRAQKLALQAKLNIGEPNDKYEKEADLTATKVVQQINSSPQEQAVQRNEVIKGEEELQMQSLGQRHENLGRGEASTDLESSIQSVRGSGQSLDPNLQTKMGQAMGADFRDVKVHTDSQSDQLNKSIQAKAFTKGNDVFFRQGAYDPSSRGGQELIAHELTHVVQQNSDSAVSNSSDQTIQRKLNVKFKKTRWFQGKDQKMLGEEKLKSLGSYDEAQNLLDMGTKDRVQRIIEAFTTGKSEKDAFKQIAFFLEGKDSGLEAKFEKKAGEPLRDLINTHLKGKPQEKSADYLISILDNNGRVPLKAQIWLVLGMVDGSPSDDERLVYLSEKASATEWAKLWQELNGDIKKNCEYQRTYTRLHERTVFDKGQSLREEAKTSGNQDSLGQEGNQAISLQSDRYLAAMIRQRVSKNLKVKTGLSGQKILADILKWKETATPEDIEQIKKPSSEFQKAIKYLPGRMMISPIGVNSEDRNFLRSIAYDVKMFEPLTNPNVQDNKVEDSSGLTGKVEDQKSEDNKTGNDKVISNIDELKREDLIKIFTTKEALTREKRTWFFERLFKGDKWDSFESEIRFMTPEQRKGFLRTYDQDPVVALQKLEEDIKKDESKMMQKGIDKGTQAVVLAHFDDRYGEIGSNYEQLLQITFGSKSMVDRRSQKELFEKKRKEKTLKLLARLRDNEYTQVRQNQKLLVAMKKAIGSEAFEDVLKLLGMKDENDQIQGINPDTKKEYTNEEVIAKANREHDVSYWVSLLEIKDKLDYSIFFRAQRVARAKQRQLAKEGNPNENYTKEFLQNIYFQTKQDSKSGDFLRGDLEKEFDKPLSESDPDLYKALYEDKDLEVNYLLKKANDRYISVDRAKTVFAFNDLDGKTLLDQWSNLKDYKSKTQNLKESKSRKAKLEEDIQLLQEKQKNVPQNNDLDSNGSESVEDLNLQRKSVESEIEKMELQNKSFVLGMSESKRLQLIKMKRMTTEDRLQMEQMFNEKLVDAISSDTDAQKELLDSGLPFDQWMATKLMSTNAILKQRKIDKTRQWDSFHNKSSQLDEGTRMVVGTVRSGDTDIKEVENDQKLSSEEKKLKIKELKSKYSKQGEEDLQERKTLESQFKDIQSRYNARLLLLIKILTTAAIMAATMGAGGAITIGIQVALLAAQAFINAGVRYFVLKENIGKTVGLGVLDFLTSATMLVGLNFGDALQASLLSTQNLGQGDFLSAALSKGMVSTMRGFVLALPKVVIKELFDRKPMGDVEDGDKEKEWYEDLGKEFEKVITKNLVKTVKGVVVASATEGEEQALSEITGIPMQNNSKPHKDFATANKDVFTTENDPHKLDKVLIKDIKKTIVKDIKPNLKKGKVGEGDRNLVGSDKNEKGDRRDRLERIRRGENTPVYLEPIQEEKQLSQNSAVPSPPDILEMKTKLTKEKEAIKREEKRLTKQLEQEKDEQKKQSIERDLEGLKSRQEKLEEHKEQLKKDKELQKELEKEENEKLQSARHAQELEAEKKFLERKQLQETEERKQQEESQQNSSSGNVQDPVNTVNTVNPVSNVQDPVKKLEIELKQAKTNSALKLREIDEAKQKIKVCGEKDKSLETNLKQSREQRDALGKSIKSTEDAIANNKKKDKELVKSLKGNDGDTDKYKLINANNMELKSLTESLKEMKTTKINAEKSVADYKMAISDNKKEQEELEKRLEELKKESKKLETLVEKTDKLVSDVQSKSFFGDTPKLSPKDFEKRLKELEELKKC